jgi:hypothetical protein
MRRSIAYSWRIWGNYALLSIALNSFSSCRKSMSRIVACLASGNIPQMAA